MTTSPTDALAHVHGAPPTPGGGRLNRRRPSSTARPSSGPLQDPTGHRSASQPDVHLHISGARIAWSRRSAAYDPYCEGSQDWDLVRGSRGARQVLHVAGVLTLAHARDLDRAARGRAKPGPRRGHGGDPGARRGGSDMQGAGPARSRPPRRIPPAPRAGTRTVIRSSSPTDCLRAKCASRR